MASVRRICLLLPLAAAMSLQDGAWPAAAQTQGGADWQLMQPIPDGDPKNPPRFRKPVYGNPPAFGASTTGFNSTNRPRAPKSAPAAEQPTLPPLAPPDPSLHPVYREQGGRRVPAGAVQPDAANSVQQRRATRRAADEDPFGPLGLRMGSFIVNSAVEIGGGYDSNPGRVPNGKGSSLIAVAPEMQIRSDWSRHELQANLRGSYTWYTPLDNFNKPFIDLNARGRIDITSQTKGLLEGRFIYATDTPGNPNLPTDVAKPPVYTTEGAAIGLSHRFNRLEITGKGIFERTDYRDARLNNGASLDMSDRNYNQFGGTLRGTYEWMPSFRPFIEVGKDRRRHEPQSAGRDSDGLAIRGGAEVEFARKLAGEFSVGTISRDYRDPTLQPLSGTLFDSSLIWAMTPLTTIRLAAITTVAESTIPNVSGTLTRDFVLEADHSFRRWLIGTLKFGYGTDDYEGLGRLDKRYFASAGLIYKLNRNVHLRGEFRQDWLRSNFSGVDYLASTLLFGVRLQQ